VTTSTVDIPRLAQQYPKKHRTLSHERRRTRRREPVSDVPEGEGWVWIQDAVKELEIGESALRRMLRDGLAKHECFWFNGRRRLYVKLTADVADRLQTSYERNWAQTRNGRPPQRISAYRDAGWQHDPDATLRLISSSDDVVFQRTWVMLVLSALTQDDPPTVGTMARILAVVRDRNEVIINTLERRLKALESTE
jgi:hypothetical protein